MLKSFISKKIGTSHGGAKAPGNKNTAGVKTTLLENVAEVALPLRQHIGAPCLPVVKIGERVLAGQVVGDSDAYLSAPVHSSVSGTVKKIIDVKMPNGVGVNAIIIESDSLVEYIPFEKPVYGTKEEFISSVRKSGAVGLGGAGFPTHVKLDFKEKSPDILVVNAAECEPFITTDYREIIENTENIINGITRIIDVLGFREAVIGIEENKPAAISLLNEAKHNKAGAGRIQIKRLKTKYPQGAEKMLIYACTGRTVPIGGLPLDAGCIVMNVSTVSFLENYFNSGIPLIKKRITIDGSAVTNPANLLVPIGAPIKDVLSACGAADVKKIILGGPMMGLSVTSSDFPVLKQNNAILAFKEKEAELPNETDCINCGRCNDSCPMMLSPVRVLRASDKKNFRELDRLDAGSCIECGCCTYNCPAKRFITQQMRLAKSRLLEHKKSKGGKNG